MTSDELTQLKERITDIYVAIGVGSQYLAAGVELLERADQDLVKIKQSLYGAIPPTPVVTVEEDA